MVTVVVPACVLLSWKVRRALRHGPEWLLGLPLALAGFALAATTIRFFARSGEERWPPWDPTRRLVVAGPYRPSATR
ncbi:MAG: hypothetical protein H6526_09670 [Actinobacteria bacterium]|nr:hypothetical protein [Actinomycetota bacterium]